MEESRHQGHSESPQSCPLPNCLINSPSSLALFSFILNTTPFLTFSDAVLEYTRIFCTLTQAGLPSQKTPLPFDQQISSHLPDSALIVWFLGILCPSVYQSPILVTLCRPSCLLLLLLLTHFSHVQLCGTSCRAAHQDFPGKSTEVGCHCLLLLMSSM